MTNSLSLNDFNGEVLNEIYEEETNNIVTSIDINILDEELPENLPENIKKLFVVDDTNDENEHKQSKQKKETQTEKDKKLVEEFYNNSTKENFNKLWQRFFYGVKTHAYKFVHDWETADDMACQTFERAWEFKDKYDITKAVYSTWIYTICRNLCLGYIYRKNKDNYINNDISDMYDSTVLTSCTAMSTDSTQFIVENGQVEANTIEDLTKKLYDTSLMEIDNLGGNYAKILRMKLVDDMKIREIAKLLDMNESTVKNYLYKGKAEIDEIIKKKYKPLYEMYLDAYAAESEKLY